MKRTPPAPARVLTLDTKGAWQLVEPITHDKACPFRFDSRARGMAPFARRPRDAGANANIV